MRAYSSLRQLEAKGICVDEWNTLSRKSVPLMSKPYDYFYTTFKNEAAQ